jgi:hypothetical protein
MLAHADKSVDDISKKATGTSGPNTSVIAPGETLLGKKPLINLLTTFPRKLQVHLGPIPL